MKAVTAVWWSGIAIAIVVFFAHALQRGEFDPSLRSPFDNTRSGHAEQWIFLRQASRHVQPGESFTVRASDRDTEMSLFMMAVGLLPEASPLPSSYYGRATGGGDAAELILEMNTTGPGQPTQTPSVEIVGGRVTKRSADP